MSYVAQREAELKEKFRQEMWWVKIAKMWEQLGIAAEFKRRAELNLDSYNRIKAEYIKRGRRPGFSPKKAVSA